jgi:IclR family KDG regulon transcriptional repressor
MRGTVTEEFAPVKSAIRTLEIIELLTRHGDGLSFGEVQQHMGWPRSSVFNLLRTMVECGHLEFDDRDRKYRIGIRLWEAGQTYVRTRDLARLVEPYLQTACTALNETVQLAVLDGLDNVYVAKVEASHHLRLVSQVGGRLPAYTTGLGKALLAGLDDAELDERLSGVTLQAFTKATITDPARLRRELAKVRADGYATDRGEFSEGVFCVGVPVRDASGRVVAAMSASAPTVRVNDQLRVAMRETLTTQAALLSKALGYDAER